MQRVLTRIPPPSIPPQWSGDDSARFGMEVLESRRLFSTVSHVQPAPVASPGADVTIGAAGATIASTEGAGATVNVETVQPGDAPDSRTTTDSSDLPTPSEAPPAQDHRDRTATRDSDKLQASGEGSDAHYPITPAGDLTESRSAASPTLASETLAHRRSTERGAELLAAVLSPASPVKMSEEKLLSVRPRFENSIAAAWPRFSIAAPLAELTGDALLLSVRRVADAIFNAGALLPAAKGPLTEVLRGGGALGYLPRQAVYHFARLNGAATFYDSLGRFINECAALSSADALPVASSSHARAWAITLAVVTADAALGAYLIRRGALRCAAKDRGPGSLLLPDMPSKRAPTSTVRQISSRFLFPR